MWWRVVIQSVHYAFSRLDSRLVFRKHDASTHDYLISSQLTLTSRVVCLGFVIVDFYESTWVNTVRFALAITSSRGEVKRVGLTIHEWVIWLHMLLVFCEFTTYFVMVRCSLLTQSPFQPFHNSDKWMWRTCRYETNKTNKRRSRCKKLIVVPVTVVTVRVTATTTVILVQNQKVKKMKRILQRIT